MQPSLLLRCTLCGDPLQARPSKFCVGGEQVQQNMLLFYMFWYIIVRIVPTTRYKGIEYTTQYILLYMTSCTEYFLQHFRHHCCNYNSSIHALSHMHPIYEALLGWNTRSRCVGMLPVRTVYHDFWLFGEESACKLVPQGLGCWAVRRQ